MGAVAVPASGVNERGVLREASQWRCDWFRGFGRGEAFQLQSHVIEIECPGRERGQYVPAENALVAHADVGGILQGHRQCRQHRTLRGDLYRSLRPLRDCALAAAAGTGLLAVLATVLNQALPLKLYPALVNAVMLVVFGTSLRFGPPLVERLARLQEPELPAFALAYTRRVTQVWCGFFVLNGGLALLTALYASDRVWMLYNGLLAYVMMGVLFAGEWLVRRRVKAAHAHG